MTDQRQADEGEVPLAHAKIIKTSAPDIIRDDFEIEDFVMVSEERALRTKDGAFMDYLTTHIARKDEYKRYFIVRATGWKMVQEGEVMHRGIIWFTGYRHAD